MVRLLPLRREFRRARPPLVKEGLDIRLAQRQTWRATVHDRADGGTVAFSPGGEPEYAAERIEAHLSSAMSGASSALARKSLVLGTRVSVRVDLGGRRIIKKKTKYTLKKNT